MQTVIRFYWRRDPIGCLANCSPHAVLFEGQLWPTAEHAFQAAKFPSNAALRSKILAAPSAEDAKQIGRGDEGTLRSDWSQVRAQVMKQILIAKFTQNRTARSDLLDTGSAILVEDSPEDEFWGCGPRGVGRNKLGEILMEVRAMLKYY